ncbi:MAG: gamma-glutamyl-gamma-aminobutyrate hydrolase family protein [Roseburia sp.]|nr:gamma-glutamyl-gamma-aminobutyrate hydrolase family protein [Roseburia sp.]MCM1098814.1 gamma-glutamyl-gamma-aminobutyrate hydrolase family protein [Ruminococcus flavefaciens]
MIIAIAGRQADTKNYVRYVTQAGHEARVTLNPEEAEGCDALILPGGGDITPAFFGEANHGSRQIDTELDILQFLALERFLRAGKPVLGICKGMQVINVLLGGTVVQDLETKELHRYRDGDQYHATKILPDSWLFRLYGGEALVNSAHHQSVGRLGKELRIIQRCIADGCPEALEHNALPVLGVQWHPERIDEARARLIGGKVLAYLASLASPSSPR